MHSGREANEGIAQMGMQLVHLQTALKPYPGAYVTFIILALVASAWIVNWITRKVLVRLTKAVLQRWRLTSGGTNDTPLALPMIKRLSNMVPGVVFLYGLDIVPPLPKELYLILLRSGKVFMLITLALALSHGLNLVNSLYERHSYAGNRPIKGFIQIAKIVLFIIIGLMILAALSGVALTSIIAGLGAVTAVLILVFQDTLLSLVASIQIRSDERIRIGDYIEMPAFDANGTVIDIALHSVSVKNSDMTTVTIPTKRFLTDGFKNWRGMYAAQGRQIRRQVHIDQRTVQFLSNDEATQLEKKHPLLKNYRKSRMEAEDLWKESLVLEDQAVRAILAATNLDLFIYYVERLLQNHPCIRQDLTLVVRQRQPTSEGVPIEIWCFANKVDLDSFEKIQNHIFSHLIAMTAHFGLDLFQVASDRTMAMSTPKSGALVA